MDAGYDRKRIDTLYCGQVNYDGVGPPCWIQSRNRREYILDTNCYGVL